MKYIIIQSIQCQQKWPTMNEMALSEFLVKYHNKQVSAYPQACEHIMHKKPNALGQVIN